MPTLVVDMDTFFNICQINSQTKNFMDVYIQKCKYIESLNNSKFHLFDLNNMGKCFELLNS